jgi:pre-rRNA-processing protein IPI3
VHSPKTFFPEEAKLDDKHLVFNAPNHQKSLPRMPSSFSHIKQLSFYSNSTSHYCLYPTRKMSSSSHEIVLTSSPDGLITAYDSSGAILARFTGSRSPRQGLALAGNAFIAASHISSATASGSVHLYNWWSSTVFHYLPLPEPVAPLTATPDGSYVFVGGLSGNIHALSLPLGNVLKSLPAHEKPVSCLKITDDGSLLISGGDDGTIVVIPIFRLVEASSANENGLSVNLILHRFAAHADSVTGLALYNTTLISCSLDSTCKFWNLLHGTHLRTAAFPCTIFGVAVNPTETEFYAAGSDGFVYKGLTLIKVGSSGREVVKWAQKHDGAVMSLMTMNEGRDVVSAAEDGSVWIREVATGHVIMALKNETESISDMVVATGISSGKGKGVNELSGGNYWSSLGLSGRELSFPVKQTLEMEDILSVAANDRSRAIDMLESGIKVYERLLELILKEAKQGSGNDGE